MEKPVDEGGAAEAQQTAKTPQAEDAYLWLQVVLGMIFLVQLFLGVAGLIGGEFLKKSAFLYYGGTLSMTPQLGYIIKMMAAYFLSVAFLTGLALNDPEKHSGVIIGLMVLMVLRFLTVVFGAANAQQAFSIPLGRVWFHGITYLVLAVLLFVFRPKVKKG